MGKKLTKDSFISTSIAKFGNKFSYNKLVCDNYNTTKLILICNIHNCEFNITAYRHLNSKTGGCKMCLSNEYSRAGSDTSDEYIAKSKSKLGEFYNESMKQTELAMLAGYYIVPDCGNSVYLLQTSKFLNS